MIDQRAISQLSQRLSLRKPQLRSLEILADIIDRVLLTKNTDVVAAL